MTRQVRRGGRRRRILCSLEAEESEESDAAEAETED